VTTFADELGFAVVPDLEHFVAGSTTEDAGVDKAGESDPGNVAGGAVDALEVPDGFGGLWVDFVQEASTIIFREHAGEAPWLVLEGLYILDVDQKNITRLGGLDLEWSSEVVNSSQIYISDVIRRIIVLDLSACPVDALDLDCFLVLDLLARRDVWVPTVMQVRKFSWVRLKVDLNSGSQRLFAHDASNDLCAPE